MTTYSEMPNGYIKRESDGAMFSRSIECIEYQEFLEWVAGGGILQPYRPPAVDPKEQAKADLAASDKEMARIAEDLIEILKTKGVIADSDLTQVVVDKLTKRKQIRDAVKM